MAPTLSPRYCLDQMAEALSKMQDAQARFAAIQADIAAGVMDTDTMQDLRLAQGDTGYYQGQANTWGTAALALMAALDRYPQAARHRVAPPVLGESGRAAMVATAGGRTR